MVLVYPVTTLRLHLLLGCSACLHQRATMMVIMSCDTKERTTRAISMHLYSLPCENMFERLILCYFCVKESFSF